MLGHYRNFPRVIHGAAQFTYKASPKNVQQAIIASFHQLSKRKWGLEEIVCSSAKGCEVDFEFGIGEDDTFTFLDDGEVERLKGEIAKKAFSLLDFLCVLQYHMVNGEGKRSPLKFDYYLLRLGFGKNVMELLVSHERGPQRVHVEDLMSFLTKQASKELADQYSVALKREDKLIA